MAVLPPEPPSPYGYIGRAEGCGRLAGAAAPRPQAARRPSGDVSIVAVALSFQRKLGGIHTRPSPFNKPSKRSSPRCRARPCRPRYRTTRSTPCLVSPHSWKTLPAIWHDWCWTALNWNWVLVNRYAQTSVDNRLFARNSKSAEGASSQLPADHYALSGRQSSSELGCDSR
jgi:hypothetical protein